MALDAQLPATPEDSTRGGGCSASSDVSTRVKHPSLTNAMRRDPDRGQPRIQPTGVMDQRRNCTGLPETGLTPPKCSG